MAPATPPHGTPSHSTPLGIESVAFATGSGRLVRRATAVLFDPTGQNPKLSSAFDDAADDLAAIKQVLHAVIEAELVAAPFAIVRWADDLDLLVFGEINLHTSCPSAPMITGAGSQTWVQHRVERALVDAGPSPQVWSGEAAEPGTNLRLGIAACDGFRLDLIVDTAAPATSDEADPVASPVVPPVVETRLAPTRSSPRPVTVETEAAAEPVAPAPLPGDDTPSLLSFAEPEPPAAEDVADPEIRVWTESEAEPLGEPAPIDSHEDDTDADPFALPVDESAEVAGATQANTTGELLEFDMVDEPAQPAVEPVLHDFSAATAEQAAPLALLIFDDRADLSVRGTSVLGRRPSGDAGQQTIAIDHPEVSRTHAEIDTGEGRGQVATIRDLGSRNGTWVQSPGGAGLRRLDADERALLLPGTIVHLGSVEVCFTWQPIDDEST